MATVTVEVRSAKLSGFRRRPWHLRHGVNVMKPMSYSFAPSLFVAFQRRFVDSFVFSGVKG